MPGGHLLSVSPRFDCFSILLEILVLFILHLKLTLFFFSPPIQGLLVTAWLVFNVARGCLNFQPYQILSKHPLSFGYSVRTRCTCISILAADVVQAFLRRRCYVDFPHDLELVLGVQGTFIK